MKSTGVATLLVLLSTVICTVKAGQPMTCETSGVVYEGFPATLTCVFKDRLHKEAFMVYRKKSARASESILALCGWEAEKLDCRHFDGFRLKTEESNGRVIFEAKSTNESQSGTYVCKTLPASESEATECSLTVQNYGLIGDDVIDCQASPAPLGEQASVSCTFPKSIGMNGIILEKFNDNNGKKREEIARCDDRVCTVKPGYENDCKMPTQLRVNVPHVSTEHTGIYICRSPSLPGVTAICPLTLPTVENNVRNRSINQLLPPMYAILVCLVVLMIAAAILGYLYIRRRRSTPQMDENGNTAKDKLMK